MLMLRVSQRRRQTFASPSTVRWSSAVDSTIELLIELACSDTSVHMACTATGVAHKARGRAAQQPSLASVASGRSGMAAGAAFATLERPTLGPVRSFCATYVTQMYESMYSQSHNASQ